MMDAYQPQVGDSWYRYEAIAFGSMDEFGDVVSAGTKLSLKKLTVSRVTAKGVWLDTGLPRHRFVLLAARARYACPTEAAALESLKARKLRQISILEAQLRGAKAALGVAETRLAKLGQEAGPAGGTLEDLVG